MDFTKENGNTKRNKSNGQTIVVNRYRIIGTDLVVHKAWILEKKGSQHSGSTITYSNIENGNIDTMECWYQAGTEMLPAAVDAIPYSATDIRIAFIKTYKEMYKNTAHYWVLQGFPYLNNNPAAFVETDGTIEINDPDLAYEVDEVSGYNDYLRSQGYTVEKGVKVDLLSQMMVQAEGREG